MNPKKVLIIAEAGVNHNGDINLAKKLIDKAAEAGADLVKFQTFKAEDIVSKNAQKADYQKKNIDSSDNTQFKMLKDLELSHENHQELLEYCKKKGVGFFSSAFDVKGIDYLNELGLELVKIPSGEVTNYPYLKRISELGHPVILSTGMSNLEDISKALEILEKGIDKKDITVLHCNSEYPTPAKDVNLKAMKTISEEFDVAVGYSDHTLGIEVPIAAVALDATVIEKHFTLDRNMPGPDHVASLEPKELKEMVKAIRKIEKAISGSGLKEPSESEQKNRLIARKSIFTAKNLSAGSIIAESDIKCLRPGDGISAMEWNSVIGKTVLKDLEEGHKLTLKDFSRV